MAKCCMCDIRLESEDAPVLSMGAAGIPRLLCDRCAGLLDKATLSKDFEEIKDAVGEIGSIMAAHDPDSVTYTIVSSLMVDASERAKAIKDGSYDFSLDENPEDGGLDEIPEDMLESEEDIEKDKADEEKVKKFDKVYNIILTCTLVLTGIVVVINVLKAFGIDLTKFFEVFK